MTNTEDGSYGKIYNSKNTLNRVRFFTHFITGGSGPRQSFIDKTIKILENLKATQRLSKGDIWCASNSKKHKT